MKILCFLALYSLPAFSAYNYDQHQLGIVIDNWTYKEPRIKDSGFLIGLHYRYEKSLGSLLNWGIGGEYLTGQTKYDGETISTGQPVQADQNNTIVQAYTYFQLKIAPVFSPVIGLSYRFLRDEDDEVNGDYQRDQSYFTVPVGFIVNFESSRFLFLYHTAFQGENKTYLTDVAGSEDLTLKQDEGSGLHAEFEYYFQKGSITAFYRTWEVADSESKIASIPSVNGGTPGGFLEPENDTVSIGLRFNVLFSAIFE